MKDFYPRLEAFLAALVAAGAEGETEELLAELRRRVAAVQATKASRLRELDQMDAHGERA